MNAAGLLKQYERVADAPDAVAKLRRLILDLAVRGKLVPQDPMDEPAAQSLKRIAAKKQLNARKDRTSKMLKAANNMSPSIYIGPAGWEFVSLAELVTVLNGRAYKQNELLSSGTPVLRVGNLFTSDRWYYSNLALDDDKYCEAGDLIFAWSASFGPFIWTGERVIYHYHIWKLELHSDTDLDKKYLLKFLLQKTREIKEAGHGVSMLHMTKDSMERLGVALPPRAEQHRIVAKVDELMALCDQLEAARAERESRRDRLAAASLARLNAPDPETFHNDVRFAFDALPSLTVRPDQLKQIRDAIFNLAVRGKLVRQDLTDEPATTLAERAKAAKRRTLAREGLRERTPLLATLRNDLKFDYPVTWEMVSFDDVFVIVSGVTKGQKVAADEAVEVPYLRVANVQRGRLDLSIVKSLVVRESDIQKYGLRTGDVLMTEGGDWDKLGRAAIWRDEIQGCIHQNHVFRVRPASSDIAPEWVIAYTNSPLGRAFFENAAKQTTNLASINLTQLRSCPLPLPPLAEQRRIIAKIDELMALFDRLQASLEASDATRIRLLDALLQQALAPTVEMQEAA